MMVFSITGRAGRRGGAGLGRPAGRPSWARRHSAGWEALEARRLLSGGAISGGFLLPSPVVVARAETVVASGASTEFSKFEADLRQAERTSRVSPAQFVNLRADGASLAQAIENSSLPSQTVTQQLDALQDVLDQSFIDGTDTSSEWSEVAQQLATALSGVTFTTDLPGQTYNEMQTIAAEAHVTKPEHQRLVADEQAIAATLGPNVDTSLGGTAPRDPLVVYYDGQVSQFVHARAR